MSSIAAFFQVCTLSIMDTQHIYLKGIVEFNTIINHTHCLSAYLKSQSNTVNSPHHSMVMVVLRFILFPPQSVGTTFRTCFPRLNPLNITGLEPAERERERPDQSGWMVRNGESGLGGLGSIFRNGGFFLWPDSHAGS